MGQTATTPADARQCHSPHATAPASVPGSPEWNFLLQCASRRAPAELALTSAFDWPMLVDLARQHGVVGLLARQVRDERHSDIPASILDSINEWQRTNAALTLQLTAELFRILEHFRAHGLDILLTKGPALSVRCYGDPAARHYGDLDLIVRHKDIYRATELMLELGYQPKIPLSPIASGKTPGEYNFLKPGTPVLIEFHTERTFRYHPRPLPMDAVFARSTSVAIDGRTVPVLSLEDEFILICIHGAKHFWERLLWIADVSALSQHPHLDWDRVGGAAAEVGAQRILHLAFRLAADLLGTPIPHSIEAAIRADTTVSQLAAAVLQRLPDPHAHPITLIQRAAFRVRLRGSLLGGLAYLGRLSVSPTEEDWLSTGEPHRSIFIDALLRPARLARKHRLPKA